MLLLAQNDDAGDGADTVLASLDLAAWDAWFRTQAPELGFCPSDFAYGIADAEETEDGEALLTALTRLLQNTWKPMLGKCALYVGLAVLAATQKGLEPASPVAGTAAAAFRAVAASAVLLSAAAEMRTAVRALTLANDTSEILLPVLLGMLTLGGMENSAAAVAASFSLYASVTVRILQVNKSLTWKVLPTIISVKILTPKLLTYSSSLSRMFLGSLNSGIPYLKTPPVL